MQQTQKGLVIKVDAPLVFVLTGDGQFIKQKAQGSIPRVGDEVTVNYGKVSPRKKIYYLAAVAAIILLIVPVINLPMIMGIQDAQAVTWVTVDINPSLEYELDKNQKIVNVVPLNADGQQLLSGQDIRGYPVEEAINIAVNRALELGFIKVNSTENTVLIAIASPKENKLDQENLQSRLKTEAEQVLKQNEVTAYVEAVSAPVEFREHAQEANLSVGKYLVMVEGIKEGLQLEPRLFEENGMHKAIASAGGDLKKLVANVKIEKNLANLQKKVVQGKMKIEKDDPSKFKPELDTREWLNQNGKGNKPTSPGSTGKSSNGYDASHKDNSSDDQRIPGNGSGQQHPKDNSKEEQQGLKPGESNSKQTGNNQKTENNPSQVDNGKGNSDHKNDNSNRQDVKQKPPQNPRFEDQANFKPSNGKDDKKKENGGNEKSKGESERSNRS